MRHSFIDCCRLFGHGCVIHLLIAADCLVMDVVQHLVLAGAGFFYHSVQRSVCSSP